MKTKIALFLIAILSTPFAVLAGEGQGKTITDEHLSRMQEHLDLTDDQLVEMRKIRDEGGSKKELRAVLTDEQKARAQEQKAARGKAGKAGKGKGEKEGKATITDEHLAKMQESLGLSDEQVTQMRQIRDDGGSAKEIKAVLTGEQKAQAQARKKEREQKKKAGDKA